MLPGPGVPGSLFPLGDSECKFSSCYQDTPHSVCTSNEVAHSHKLLDCGHAAAFQ